MTIKWRESDYNLSFKHCDQQHSGQNTSKTGNVYKSLTISEYMFLPHSSTMMATGCLYDAIFALGSKYMELRRTLPELMSQFVDINKVSLALL